MQAKEGGGALALPADDGCRPGYYKRTDINLCVPKPAA